MKFFRFFCYVCLVSLVFVGTGCAMAMQRMPAPIPPVVVVQETSPSPVVVTKSCEDAAWNFDPNRDIPNFGDACAWHPTEVAHVPWLFEFYIKNMKRKVSVDIGCIRYYVHRYANVVGVEFYVFCRKDVYPDILGWNLIEDESPVGWLAVADEDGSWVPMGWGAILDVEADITTKPLQVHWLRFLVQSNSAQVERIFERGKK